MKKLSIGASFILGMLVILRVKRDTIYVEDWTLDKDGYRKDTILKEKENDSKSDQL